VRSGGKLFPGLREDEKLGEPSRGAAKSLTEQRTDQMILVISIGIVFTLAVGVFVIAANSIGDQNQSPFDNQQKTVLDNFDLVETAQPQSLKEQSLEELGFVIESESGCWGPICTEQGSIDFGNMNLPSELPLCVTNSSLSQYFVDVLVVGGYNPWLTGGYIQVWQKGESKGFIYILWTHSGDGPCCASDYWTATFYVKQNLCLESNQYPDVNLPWKLDYVGDQTTIPGKCVTFDIMTYWTGCKPQEQPSQDFTIIYSHSIRALSLAHALTIKR